MSVRQVVVVGGGIGGVSTVANLRARGYAGDLVLVDTAEFPYDRPPLSKEYLAGTRRALKEIALRPSDWYSEYQVRLIAETEVVALCPREEGVSIRLGGGRQLSADLVVLATGASPVVPSVPGVGSAGVQVLRDAEDADLLRPVLEQGGRLLVVGGGLIGAEVASTARELGADVVLLDPLDPPLAAAVGVECASWLHGLHARHGVETVTTTLESLHETGAGIEARFHGDTAPRRFDAVLVGVGVRPRTALAERAGIAVDRGVVVDEDQVTSHPRVLAVGDCCRRRGHRRAEHWESAKLDGERAAAAILAQVPPARTAAWFWTDRYKRHVEAVGELRSEGTQRTLVRRGDPEGGPFSIFAVEGDRLVGAVAVDDSRTIRAARRLIDRATRLQAPEQLRDPDFDVRTLLRE